MTDFLWAGEFPLDIKQYLEEKKALIEDWLERYMSSDNLSPPGIYQAMRYSLMAKSKRIRPVLTLAAAESLEGKIELVLPFACALELIHTYSLIHDDLPAMDNDDFRRGQPSSHKAFGEDMAILAGDALLTQAFILMSSAEIASSIPPDIVLQGIHEICKAAGTQGMIGGQVMDMDFTGQSVTLLQVETMHSFKTGALILAAIRVGGLVAGASEEQMQKLSRYGRHIGLTFQIVDDVLDVEGKPELLGKAVGKDCSARKATFPSVLGLEESKKYAKKNCLEAIQALEGFGDRADILRALARFITFREF